MDSIDQQKFKDLGKFIGEFMTKYMTMIKCASQHCSNEINRAKEDKDLIEKFSKYNLEQHKPTKLQIFFELNDNTVMYDINKCAIKNCKKFVNNVLKTFDSYLKLLPNKSPTYNTLNKVITTLKKIVNSRKPITKNEYTTNIKEIRDLLKTLN